ncbi:MAG: hypothetical protein Pg6C_20360 [Treponemataceae bacterium]|nr:MAG: hypothetical protein Pg6C_20360 [Treponemataceae bacterium]
MKTNANFFKVIAIGAIITAAFAACGGGNITSIDGLLAFFKKSGIAVSNKETLMYQFVKGAKDGCRVELNGESVEIYKFDATVEEGKTILANAEKDGTFLIGTLKMSCLVKGPFIISTSSLFGGLPQEAKEKISGVLQKAEVE